MQGLAPARLECYRALFDPRWIPADLVGRDKELSFLRGFLVDNLAIKQEHPSNDGPGSAILINGMGGIGKATLARKAMHAVAARGEHEGFLPPVSIDCREKEQGQVMAEIAGSFKLPDETRLGTPSTSSTWNVLSSWLRKHVDCTRVNVCLSNIETMPLPFVVKLASNLKSLGVNMILTTRARYNATFIDQVDVDISLDEYRPGDLHRIVDTRARCAFDDIVSADTTRFITDAVIEYDSPRPLPCINILRALYPRLKNDQATSVLSLDVVQQCIRHALPDLGYGEFDMADYFSGAPVHAIVFVDNILSWFDRGDECYLPHPALENMYHMACEHLDITTTSDEFNGTVADLLAHNILVKSNHGPGMYFMMVPPSIMRTFIDEVLC